MKNSMKYMGLVACLSFGALQARNSKIPSLTDFVSMVGSTTGLYGSSSGEVLETMSFSPDSKKILVAFGHFCKLLHADSGKLIAHIAHKDDIESAYFAADQKTILTESRDYKVRLSNADDGSNIGLIEHTDTISVCMFSPDSSKVLTASFDGTAKIFDVRTGLEIATITHEDQVTMAMFAPNSQLVITGSVDGTVKIVDATLGEVIATVSDSLYLSNSLSSS